MKISIRQRRVGCGVVVAVFAVAAVMVVSELREQAQIGRQLASSAWLRATGARIERERSPSLPLDQARIESIVAASVDGLDAWGNPVLTILCPGSPEPAILLISKGSDGILDVEDPEVYCEWTPAQTTIRTDPSKDIIFRDGEAIQATGK